ncbi:MAG: TIM barrel protein [Cyclobacteriaceae bacterium]|nr:TIM barrel protein [Cyclobacteriaceae bacterium]
MRIGLGTYALAWSIGVPGHSPKQPMDIYSFLNFANTHGFRLVQIADNLPLLQLGNDELEKIYKVARALDIAIELGTRGLTLSNVEQHLAIARLLHADLLRIVIDKADYQPDMNTIHATIKALVPLLEACHIRLAIENHDRLKASDFSKIIEQANSALVGICLDSVNSLGADEGFASVFEVLAPHTINLHLKDYTIHRKSHMMGFDVTGTPAGEGMLPIREVVKVLEFHGKCQSMILELWPAPEPAFEDTVAKEQRWVEQSARYLFHNFKNTTL